MCQPFCLGCPLLSYRKTLEFTRQELLVYLSKCLFPGTHDSSNLYLRNGAAGVQTYICYVPDGMQAHHWTSAYSHAVTRVSTPTSSQIAPVWSLTALQVMPPNPEMSLRTLGLCIFHAVIDSLEAFEGPQAPDALI